jgi:HAMP domain-containing protein
MKIKVFLIVCIGAVVILGISSILIFTQLRSVQKVNLEPLTDSLFKEDSKILTWILSSIPPEKINALKLPESWAEVFVVNNSDLQLVSSTNTAHKGVALYQHPQLLDQAAVIVNAIKTKKSTTVSSKEFMVVIQPLTAELSIVALKPKAWENNLFSQHNKQIEDASSNILMIMGIFLIIGSCIALLIAYFITRTVAAPTSYALDALEALSLGDFNQEIEATKSREMESFTESYLRLKTSLEIALERISRR